MRLEAIVSRILVPIACLAILLAAGSPSYAQLGTRLFGAGGRRDRLDDPPPPKPPVPPLGMTIHAPQPPKPLPAPIPAPPVPPLDEASPRPSQEQPAGETAGAEPESPPELSPELAELRDSVRRTLVAYYNRPPSVQANTPGDLIRFCMVFGPQAEVRGDSTSRSSVNGIAALCSNRPCAGRYLIDIDGSQFVPRVGYGLQSRQGEFLAMLAMAGVSIDQEVEVGGVRGTVADLVRREQLDVQSGNDLSFTMIGLANYLPGGTEWENSAGESWSLDRLAAEELGRQVDVTEAAAVDRLIGLTYFVKLGEPSSGRVAQVESYLQSFQDHALKLQNADGSWSPYYFGYRATSRDTTGTLRSTGHILQWLAISLPEDRLRDLQVVRAVARVNSILSGQASRVHLSSLSARDVATYLRALNGLSIYNQRVFRPCDPPPEPESETDPEVEKTAQGPDQSDPA